MNDAIRVHVAESIYNISRLLSKSVGCIRRSGKKSPRTYLRRSSDGFWRKKETMPPCAIHSLTKQTGRMSDMPRNGTMFGWRRHLHATTSSRKLYQMGQTLGKSLWRTQNEDHFLDLALIIAM